MKGILCACSTLLLLAAIPGAALSATDGGNPPMPSAAEHDAAAEPGAFCIAASCRSRPGSVLTGAAFGAVVLAIGWQARRGRSASGSRSPSSE